MEILKRVNVDEGEKKAKKKEPEAKEEANEWKEMVEEICKEVPAGQAEVLKVIQTILKNLIEYPKEKKYRVIKLDNKKIQSTIGSSNTAIKFLTKLGFERMGEVLTLFNDKYNYKVLEEAKYALMSSSANTNVIEGKTNSNK